MRASPATTRAKPRARVAAERAVAGRNCAPHPQPFAPGGRDLVAHPLPDHLALELREREQEEINVTKCGPQGSDREPQCHLNEIGKNGCPSNVVKDLSNRQNPLGASVGSSGGEPEHFDETIAGSPECG